MITAIRNYFTFLWRCARIAFVGDWRYYTWMGALSVFCLLGLNAYCKQLAHGLIVTGMSDQVSWGVYIANFTFLVGVAAAAVMLVIPVYIYRNAELHDLVIFGELLAVAAILMCLAFVTVDLGRPDRFWHLVPYLGKFNFPGSMLSWDVIVLNGYLLLNVYICGYLLYCRYRNRRPAKWFYIPFVFIGIFWAVSIHTVTAFLYVGLGGRPFWNSAIVGPRFIASAFTAGPAMIILALQIIRRVTATSQTAAGLNAVSARTTGRPATAEDFRRFVELQPELGSITSTEISSFLRGATWLELSPGETLLRQGDRSGEISLVVAGQLEVVREEAGRSRVTRVIGPGDVSGEYSSLAKLPRTASAIATQPTEVIRIAAADVAAFLRPPVIHSFIHHKMSERLLISDRALLTLRSIVQVSMLINLFLLANEVFKEFYTDNLHVASARYLYFGLHGHHALVPWIWTAITFNVVAMVLLALPASR